MYCILPWVRYTYTHRWPQDVRVTTVKITCGLMKQYILEIIPKLAAVKLCVI